MQKTNLENIEKSVTRKPYYVIPPEDQVKPVEFATPREAAKHLKSGDFVTYDKLENQLRNLSELEARKDLLDKLGEKSLSESGKNKGITAEATIRQLNNANREVTDTQKTLEEFYKRNDIPEERAKRYAETVANFIREETSKEAAINVRKDFSPESLQKMEKREYAKDKPTPEKTSELFGEFMKNTEFLKAVEGMKQVSDAKLFGGPIGSTTGNIAIFNPATKSAQTKEGRQ